MLLAMLAPLLVGCQGCRDDDSAEKPEQRAEAAISPQPIRTSPEDAAVVGVPVKPGHWMTFGQSWKANAEDYRGVLRTAPQWLGDAPERYPNGWPMHALRPAVLPKGQTKRLETRLLIPPRFGEGNAREALHGRFEAPQQGIIAESSSDPALVMAADEYFFVVLTERPEQFSMLQVQDWVRPPLDPQFGGRRSLDYRVVIPTGEGSVPVPDTFFEWTSTAYVLWDDLAPTSLTGDQRQALRDWVQWGGQIILNGPEAARSLAGSEFADLLPIDAGGSEGLDSQRLATMLRNWSVETDRSVVALVTRLAENDAAWAGVAGEPRSGVQVLPETEGLVVEYRVGRGRVAMTRFDLTAGWLPQWDSLQSFYNSALLRRPPRAYQASAGTVRLGFTGTEGRHPDDARLATRLRIFARDATLPMVETGSPDASEEGGARNQQNAAGSSSAGRSASTAEGHSGRATLQAAPAAPPLPAAGAVNSLAAAEEPSPWLDRSVSFTPGAALGAWTDRSDTGLLATQLLRDEAGIQIPKTAFVARSLAIYLVILVPLNVIIFSLLGRREWAWVAVPVIGLAGAAIVARSAQLDIGFARSRTEVDLLEMQGGYARGHLSRYLAIYNSLTTNYQFRFETREAVATPLGIVHGRASDAQFTFRQSFDQGVALSGVSIASNQTKAIHAEQMLDAGGAIRFVSARDRLENASELELWDAVVVSRAADGELRSDSLGVVGAGEIADVRWRGGAPEIADSLPMGVESVIRRLATGEDLEPGETRLVARCETAQPGLVVEPAVSQSRQQTVVLVHLERPPLPSPAPDQNLRTDIAIPEQGND